MAHVHYGQLAYEDLNDFVFGRSKRPITLQNGLSIGTGFVYPELNFTLPPMMITPETMPEVLTHYRDIIDGACKRAVELFVPDLVVEVELLPPATYNPQWGIDIIKTVRDVMWEYESKHGLKSALRATPVDIREDRHSPHMWHGSHWDLVMQTFEGCARAGADFLAIESIGGKDVHDDAILYCEIDKSLFALAVLGAMDMSRLWRQVVSIADKAGSIASGDTACAFANTAMVLAEKQYVPRVFAAVVRVISAVRSLVAVEEGAKGPHKDCGYEGVYVKAITGIPISMEGKSSACAHLSPVGNIAACVADLWSNESVQNIKLLAGMAPTVSLEQLAYDCRLMNEAASRGHQTALLLRDMLCATDEKYDPQAFVLRPDVVLDISKEIIRHDTYVSRARAAALKAVALLREAHTRRELHIAERELPWLDTMQRALESIPADEDAFIAEMVSECSSEKFDPKKYDL